MSLKGIIQPDHASLNQFRLSVFGLLDVTFITVSGISEELQIVDMPDRTKASGGQTSPIEFTAQTMIHHTVERVALEAWYKEGQDPVTSTYKKIATLTSKGISGAIKASFLLSGCFIYSMTLPDFDKTNEGEPAMIEWGFSADDMLPV